MDQYLVIGPDGKEFGPIDLAGLQQWIREGRVLKADASTKERRRRDRRRKPAGGRRELCAAVAGPHTAHRHDSTDPHGVQVVGLYRAGLGALQATLGSAQRDVPDPRHYRGHPVRWSVPVAHHRHHADGRHQSGRAGAAGRPGTHGRDDVQRIRSVRARRSWRDWSSALLVSVGLVFLIVPGIFLAIIWSFTNLVIAETNQDFWTAMQTSADADQGIPLGSVLSVPGADRCRHSWPAGVLHRHRRRPGRRRGRLRARVPVPPVEADRACSGLVHERASTTSRRSRAHDANPDVRRPDRPACGRSVRESVTAAADRPLSAEGAHRAVVSDVRPHTRRVPRACRAIGPPVSVSIPRASWWWSHWWDG